MRVLRQTTRFTSHARQRTGLYARSTPTYALATALACALLISGCDAQSPQSKSASESVSPNSGGLFNQFKRAVKGPIYQEPALVGKVIDADTRQPIEGVFIYGFYATVKGSLGGGSSFAEHVQSFETVTNAQGIFELPAWNSGDRSIGGDRGNRSPSIAIYKPGYPFANQSLHSIAEWRPEFVVDRFKKVTPQKTANRIDWSEHPYELKSIANDEKARYQALDNSGVTMMMVGECGWETYARLLLAQHNEWKDILKQSFPPEQLRADGYSRGQFNHPDPQLRSAQATRTSVDRLIQQKSASSAPWKCADPQTLFAVRK